MNIGDRLIAYQWGCWRQGAPRTTHRPSFDIIRHFHRGYDHSGSSMYQKQSRRRVGIRSNSATCVAELERIFHLEIWNVNVFIFIKSKKSISCPSTNFHSLLLAVLHSAEMHSPFSPLSYGIIGYNAFSI